MFLKERDLVCTSEIIEEELAIVPVKFIQKTNYYNKKKLEVVYQLPFKIKRSSDVVFPKKVTTLGIVYASGRIEYHKVKNSYIQNDSLLLMLK